MDNRSDDRASLVRHEERLSPAVERVPGRAARVRKRVITETVTLEVEVQREILEIEDAEETTLERPVDGAGEVVGAGELDRRDPRDDVREEEVRTFVLHRQRPVVTLETVPYEEASVVKRVTTVAHEVTDTVRREHVDVEEVDADGTVRGDIR